MSKSISLLRTNVALTTNVKLVVDKQYNLYLESYDTNRKLSEDRFKRFKISPNSFLSERIAAFYRNVPSEIAFDVKHDIDIESVQETYDLQYDDIYYNGAQTINDNRYLEEFQFNTTLRIGEILPNHFFIFRIDGIGLIDYTNQVDFFKNMKLVSHFDLSDKTKLGQFWKKNYKEDDELPRSPIELNFRPSEFSSWNGYDFKSGGTVSKSFLLEEYFRDETGFYDFEKFITQGFRKNEVVASNYSNISFLFDDTVAKILKPNTPYSLTQHPYIYRLIKQNVIKPNQIDQAQTVIQDGIYYFNEYIPYHDYWSVNRYTGFYIDDIKFINQISPYSGIKFKTNTTIQVVDNVFLLNGNPVNPIDGVYNKDIPNFIKIKNKYYLVEQQSQLVNNEIQFTGKFSIISDEIINGQLDDLLQNSQKTIKIDYIDPQTDYHSYIRFLDDTYYWEDIFDLYESGCFVIEIDNEMYSLYLDHINKQVYINTDEYIICNANILSKQLADNDKRVSSMQVLNRDNNITYFKIYQVQFTDIKDFDFNRTNTTYSLQEYEQNNTVNYERQGLYGEDLIDKALPRQLYFDKYFQVSVDNNGTIDNIINSREFLLPNSSEYGASYELYQHDKLNQLIDIWSTNQYVNKWGINDSINNNSYPCRINNNLAIGGVYNHTSNMLVNNLDISQMNLDYFYTIGTPTKSDFSIDLFDNGNILTGTGDENTVFRTLNIDMINAKLLSNNINTRNIYDFQKFDIDFYKSCHIDYLSYILDLPNDLTKGKSKVKRYSFVQPADIVNGNEIYFKGFNANIEYVNLLNPNNIDSDPQFIPANDLTGYKFTIIFTPRYIRNNTDLDKIGTLGIENIINKKCKNILINMYMYIQLESFTSLCYRKRDEVYDDEYLSYINYDTISGNHNWVETLIPTRVLTLNYLINVLYNYEKQDTYFKEVKYTILDTDEVERFTLSNIDLLTGNETYEFKFDQDIDFKAGEFIKLHNTDVLLFDTTNFKIINVLNNKTIQIIVTGDQSINFSVLNTNINDITITHEESVLPFRFKIKQPEFIKINKYANDTLTEKFALPVENTYSNIQHLLVKPNDKGLMENVLSTTNIVFKKIKTSYRELTFSQIDKLPSLFRFNGDYEPILKDITIFNENRLITIHTDNDQLPLLQKVDNEQISGQWHLIVYVNVVPDTVKIDDLLYFDPLYDDININGTDTVDYTMHKIKSIEQINNSYKIVLYTTYDIPFINQIIELNTLYNIRYYKYLPSNNFFATNLYNFGINDDVIIAKKDKNKEGILSSSREIFDTNNKYPFVDEHGSTVIDRNIFKSPYDLKYYYFITPKKFDKI